MAVDATKFRIIEGDEKSFGLKHKEVILTFDDGPISGKTSRILKALKKECVKATFFYVGRMARAYPKLVRRVVADGHTLAHHTNNHNRLPAYSSKNVSRHVDRGVRALQKIAYGINSSTPRIRFFRYPYFSRNRTTDRVIAKKGMVVFGANIDALDWKKKSAYKIRKHIMRQLRREGKGIILMHDIHARTAKMLPDLLRDLKKGGYRVVHIVPKGMENQEKNLRGSPQLVASLENPIYVKKQAEKTNTLADKNKPNTAAKKASFAVSTASVSKTAEKTTKRDLLRTGIKLKRVKRTASRKLKKLKRSKRKRVKTNKKRRKLVVLAGGKRRGKINVAHGGWKLRRSQWILN